MPTDRIVLSSSQRCAVQRRVTGPPCVLAGGEFDGAGRGAHRDRLRGLWAIERHVPSSFESDDAISATSRPVSPPGGSRSRPSRPAATRRRPCHLPPPDGGGASSVHPASSPPLPPL